MSERNLRIVEMAGRARSGSSISGITFLTGRSRPAVMKVLGRAGIQAVNGRDRYSAEDRAAAEALGISIGAVAGACDRVGFKKRDAA